MTFIPYFLHADFSRDRSSERGNVLFIILLAVVLIGLLTAAIQSTSRPEGSNIDAETLVIRASEVQQYAGELERAVRFIMENGKSESDIRFSHPNANADYDNLSADADPSDQVFSPSGGAAAYRSPPAGVNDGSSWEFYGGTAMPGMGSSAADLIAVLPNVTPEFCERINILNGQNATPTDTGGSAASGANPGDCLNIGALGRFSASQKFYTPANTVDVSSFAQDSNTGAVRAAPQACVQCTLDSKWHFYHVLLAR
ncbi:MAG: hypothetical protein IT559_04740 [Alphaproteobacteria bacterium]|nr:hypothetical protein [Alphaproteobacteria bacterium]